MSPACSIRYSTQQWPNTRCTVHTGNRAVCGRRAVWCKQLSLSHTCLDARAAEARSEVPVQCVSLHVHAVVWASTRLLGLFWGGVKLGTGLGREKGGLGSDVASLQSFHSASPQSSPLLARWRVRGIATLLLAPRPSSVQPRLLRAAAAPHRSESTLSVLLLPCHHPCRHNGKGGGC